MTDHRPPKQPPLVDNWGCPYFGNAETITGGVWWYTDACGRRYPLRPEFVNVGPFKDEPRDEGASAHD